MQIGFIGLGNMGGPMAANLVAAGHDVVGFDLSGAYPASVQPAPSAAKAAAGRDVVITMLPNGQILRDVAAEILPAMKAGALFIDCSTVDVASARDVAQQAAAIGVVALDAPVSGGTGGGCCRHADLYGRGRRCGVCCGASRFRCDGAARGALRPCGQRTGGQDLQQYDFGCDNDRHLRSLCFGR